MKQLFHLKSRNLNETNLTSSKAKTLNGRISVRVLVQNSPPMSHCLTIYLARQLIRPGSRIRTQIRNSREPEHLFYKIKIRYAHSISKALEQKRLNCTRRVLGGLNYQSHDVRQSVLSSRSRKLI